MKNLIQRIVEGLSKPSDLRKYKRTERKETVHFRGSDMYDLKDPGYDDEFSYFDGSGNGYIKDKQGHVYDVIATDRAGDAGYIAGGAHDYYVTIKKANGTDDFHVHGWIAIMSKGSNTGCIEDIKAGYYLEDYIAKYWNDWDDKDGKFKELAEKGDKNAKAYDDQKAEKIQNKKVEFDTRYITIPERISWEIIDGNFNINNLNLTSGSIKELENKRSEWLSKNCLKSWEAEDNPEFVKMKEEILAKSKELKETIMGVLKPVLIDRLQKVFKTKDLKSLSGLTGSFVYEHKLAKGKSFGYIRLAVDTKKKEFVFKDEVNYKIVDSDIELQLNDNIAVFKDRASDKMLALFKKVSEAWKKANGRKQSEYVKDHWEKIYNDSAGGYIYGNHSKTKGQAKEEAKQDFEKIVKDHDFSNISKNRFDYSLALVQVYVEGDMEPDAEPVEKPLENPEPKEKKERGKDTKMSKGANAAAYDKMKAWHEGTRKQNIANCSDAKLKMNYRVCKELGYKKEMGLLQAEAEKRGIKIDEKLSLREIVLCDSEIDDEKL